MPRMLSFLELPKVAQSCISRVTNTRFDGCIWGARLALGAPECQAAGLRTKSENFAPVPSVKRATAGAPRWGTCKGAIEEHILRIANASAAANGHRQSGHSTRRPESLGSGRCANGGRDLPVYLSRETPNTRRAFRPAFRCLRCRGSGLPWVLLPTPSCKSRRGRGRRAKRQSPQAAEGSGMRNARTTTSGSLHSQQRPWRLPGTDRRWLSCAEPSWRPHPW